MIPHFKSEKHKFLSNFYPVPVKYEGRVFPTSEHAYMSAKSGDDITISKINGETEIVNWKDFCSRGNVSAGEIKKMSRSVKLIDGWDIKKFDVMYNVLRSKFSDSRLKKLLLETGDENLQEGNWHNDEIWGIN